MAKQVVMPRLSDTMETGTIARWVKREGESVKKGEVIAEIETDKANMELESYDSGILANVTVGEGESAAVGQPIATIASDEDEAVSIKRDGAKTSPVNSEKSTAKVDADTQGAARESPPKQRVISQESEGQAQATGRETAERVKASPLARRMAQEQRIDLATVPGNGPGGRITKEDIEAFVRESVESEGQKPSAAPAQITSTRGTAPSRGSGRGEEPAEMTRMQQTIARRMAAARFSAPDFVLTSEFDMTEAQAVLASIKEIADAPRVGPNDLLIKAVASALRQHPELNAGWGSDQIVLYRRVNVGSAVAIEGGLVVPVIRDADEKSLWEIAKESKELIGNARTGKLAPSEYGDGTFTVSNLGMYGIDQFTPIINVPEACILGVGSIAPKPVVVDGQVVIRERMRVDLACDHRVVNGAQGAEFLQTLRRLLEHPALAVLPAW